MCGRRGGGGRVGGRAAGVGGGSALRPRYNELYNPPGTSEPEFPSRLDSPDLVTALCGLDNTTVPL